MKKIIISTIVAMTAVCANAQVETTPIPISNSYLYGIGEGFNYNHEISVVSMEVGSLRVFDENLNHKKVIETIGEPSRMSVHNFNSHAADYTICLSQTLFNDDEKYEYVVEGIGSLQVVSEDGTVLQTLDYPENVEVYSDNIDVFIIGDNKYLQILSYEDADGKKYRYFYKINKSGDPSKVSIATAPMRVSVSPRVAECSQDITVVAEGSGLREVIVTNAAGQVVYSTKAADGENTVRINSRHLSSGLNVVSVKGADGKDENCKVIVKK